MSRVAIIGAGPSGIAAARWLKSRGFESRIFEAYSELGGQWSASNPLSGVWPQMVTNTFLEATRFSDMAYPEGTALYPHNRQVRQYFEDYAKAFDLLDRIEFNTRLVSLEAAPGEGWALTLERDGQERTEHFPKVVVATGRFNKPTIPTIPGDGSFAGELGIIHSFDYKEPLSYQGKNVMVLGGAISSLEIASDLSMLGANNVYLAQRRQRYVNPKMVQGLPLEYIMFSHERGRLALDDPEGFAQDSQQKCMECAGDPSRYGTPKPHPDFNKAGTTGSQHYLNLVAEGRVKPVDWPSKIDGTSVKVGEDTLEIDGIIAGTGFALNLPYLTDEIAETLKLSDSYIELDEFTLHPDLPGLAFLGLWSQAGSYPTPIEQQARYLTYVWSGAVERSKAQMRAGLQACRKQGHHQGYRTQSEMALRFARLCGTDPAGQLASEQDAIARASATTGLLYRVTGPDAAPDGFEQLKAQYDRFNT